MSAGDFPTSRSVWYIRAGEIGLPEGRAGSQGSAVAVRLRRDGACLNFLLTCAHVIRRPHSKNELGPQYAEIRAWAPGSGYNPHSGYAVDLAPDVYPIGSCDRKNFYSQPVVDVANADWALLAFKDLAKSNDRGISCAQTWIDTSPIRGTECYIIGYPGGSAAFKGLDRANDDVVRPSLPYGRQIVTVANNGVVEFAGSHSRRGMSGGGVFTVGSSDFVGLHRERHDPVLQLHAVSWLQIKDVLRDCGYEICPPTDNGNGVPVGPDTVSAAEWQSIAVALLKTAVAACAPGKRIEVTLGSGRRLEIIVSGFASDSMQRLALKGALDLLQTQYASRRNLEDKSASGLYPGADFSTQIERMKVASDETLRDIRNHIALMVNEFRLSQR